MPYVNEKRKKQKLKLKSLRPNKMSAEQGEGFEF
jgi:hypothetical protein